MYAEFEVEIQPECCLATPSQLGGVGHAGPDLISSHFSFNKILPLHLVLPGGVGLGHEADVDRAEVVAPHSELELPERLHERHACKQLYVFTSL